MTSLLMRVGAPVAAVVIAVLTTAWPANAHAALSSSDPTEGDRIDTPPTQITLTFNQNVEQMFAALTVTGPDGSQWGHGAPRAQGRDLVVDLAGLGPAGRYTVAFRVVSADGHPI